MFGAIEKSVLDKVVEQTERLTPPPSRTVTSVGKNSIIRSKHELENSCLEHEFNAEKKNSQSEYHYPQEERADRTDGVGRGDQEPAFCGLRHVQA